MSSDAWTLPRFVEDVSTIVMVFYRGVDYWSEYIMHRNLV